MKIFKKILELNRYQFYTAIIFLFSFSIATFDTFYIEVGTNLIEDLPNWKFIVSYIIISYILYQTVLILSKLSTSLQILKKDLFKVKLLKVLKNISIGYYIGVLIGFSNAFILEIFERFIIGGV